jgi:tetratricopeptide (TPR) repeat protein
VLLAQKEFGEAARASEEALRLSAGRAPPFHTRILQALRRNGEAHVGLGDLDGGIATLERAAQDAGDPDASPWDAARIHFALAQALWTKEAERKRALELAARARDELTGLHSVVEAARASAWIAAHRGR